MAALETVTVTSSRINSPEDSSNITSGDSYQISKLEIISSDGVRAIDTKSLLLELSYFEDIFRSVTTGHILINDSIDFINGLKFNGTEKIRIEFRKTEKSERSTGISKTYKIVRLGDRIRKNFSTETYSIHFCSEELFFSEQTKISKSYKGKKISEIVTDILTNYLNVPQEKQIVEETDGLYDFVIPYKKPFEAINMVMNYARSTENNSAYDFVFFEDKHGFNFLSLQSIYGKNKDAYYRAYSFSPKSYQSTSNIAEKNRSLATIHAFTFLDTFDSLYGTTTGAFANRVITVDPMTRRYYVTDFDYNQNFNELNHLNSYPLQDIKNTSFNSKYESVLKVLTTNRNQEKALGIEDKPGSVAKDTYNEDRVRFRTAQMALSQFTRVRLNISGDPNLNVGDIIFAQFPFISENEVAGIDEYHSGRYLVTAVRHIIDANMEYETILEITKDSFRTPVNPEMWGI